MLIDQIRTAYHDSLCQNVIRLHKSTSGETYPNFADGSSKASRQISMHIIAQFNCIGNGEPVAGQTAGRLFEQQTLEFVESGFSHLFHLRPGEWKYYTEQTAISQFEQYDHLSAIEQLVSFNSELKSALGTDYIVTPDIVIARIPESDLAINQHEPLIGDNDKYGVFTP